MRKEKGRYRSGAPHECDACRLVRFLLERAVPLPAVLGALDALHAQSMILWIASGGADDDDVITGLEGGGGKALGAQLHARSPLDRPPLHLALFVGGRQMDVGMRITEDELDEVALDRL